MRAVHESELALLPARPLRVRRADAPARLAHDRRRVRAGTRVEERLCGRLGGRCLLWMRALRTRRLRLPRCGRRLALRPACRHAVRLCRRRHAAHLQLRARGRAPQDHDLHAVLFEQAAGLSESLRLLPAALRLPAQIAHRVGHRHRRAALRPEQRELRLPQRPREAQPREQQRPKHRDEQHRHEHHEEIRQKNLVPQRQIAQQPRYRKPHHSTSSLSSAAASRALSRIRVNSQRARAPANLALHLPKHGASTQIRSTSFHQRFLYHTANTASHAIFSPAFRQALAKL